MKLPILFTLLATPFSSVSAISGTDVTEVLTSEAETASGSFIGFDNDAGSIACQFHCIISSASNAEASDCMSTRCGGVRAESGDEANADASEVAISEVDTAPHPDIVKFQCYYGCFIQGRNDDEVEDCILLKCEGDKAKNSDKGNIDNSDDGISEILISEAETVPGVGLDCYYRCLLEGRSIDAIDYCVRMRCGGEKAENSNKANADASEVVVSDADTASHPNIIQCYHDCFNQGLSFPNVEVCIATECRIVKAKDSNKGNIDKSEVRISKTESTARTALVCTHDCVRALGIDTVSAEDINQCARECGLGKKESNLRGSIK